ncbi:MAG: HD domain-containing phosphohydrolase [Candidatus Izemoplasmatales bacterium]
MKIFQRPVYLVTLFVLVFFAVFSAFFYYSGTVVRSRQERLLPLERDTVALAIEQHFNQFETIIHSITHFLEINDDDAELLAFIEAIDFDHDEIASIYLGRPDLTMVNSSGFVAPPGFDLTTRLWYQMAYQAGDFIYTPAFINVTEDGVIVVVAYPVYLDDVFLGVVGMDIDIRTITCFVSDRVVGDTGYSLLMDQNGILLAYPELDQSTISLDSAEAYSSGLSGLVGEDFQTDFPIKDVYGAIAHRSIARDSYHLVVFMPMVEFTQYTSLLSNIFIGLTIALLIFTLLFTILYFQTISKPMKNLIKDIKTIDPHSEMLYRLPNGGRLSFPEVRQALNNVLDVATEFFEEKEKGRLDLLIENQRVKLLVESTADIIFEIGVDKRFCSIYGRGLEKLRMNPTHVIGKTVLEIFKDDGLERDRLYSLALQGEHHIYDWDYQVDGTTYYYESSISPIFNQDHLVIGAVGISRDITEPKMRQREIEYLNIHDFLTGLYNRRHFVERLSILDEKKHHPLGVMMIDVNGLKIINDAYGHPFGDKALIKTAEVLLEQAAGRDDVFRIGGDEFAIIVCNTSDVDITQYVERIHERLKEITIDNIPLSVAIGYSIKTDHEQPFDEMMIHAENLMYRNKVSQGRSVRNHAIKAIYQTLTQKYLEEKIHSERVGTYARKMGEALNLRPSELDELEMAGIFHDIGKITIPDEILKKPGKLTDKEYELIKAHAENGYHILRAADMYSGLAEHALNHHERWDGTGYPSGLKGEQIPLFSRIIALADAFEAMTSDRPYRKRLSEETAVREIIRYSGTQFDPDLSQIFIEKVLLHPFSDHQE